MGVGGGGEIPLPKSKDCFKSNQMDAFPLWLDLLDLFFYFFAGLPSSLMSLFSRSLRLITSAPKSPQNK